MIATLFCSPKWKSLKFCMPYSTLNVMLEVSLKPRNSLWVRLLQCTLWGAALEVVWKLQLVKNVAAHWDKILPPSHSYHRKKYTGFQLATGLCSRCWFWCIKPYTAWEQDTWKIISLLISCRCHLIRRSVPHNLEIRSLALWNLAFGIPSPWLRNRHHLCCVFWRPPSFNKYFR